MASVRRQWNRFDLRTKLISLFAIFAIVPLIGFGIFTYWKSSRLVVERVEQVVSENLTQLNHSIDYFIRDVEQLATYIYTNNTIQSTLQKPAGRPLAERYEDRRGIDELLDSFLGFKDWDIDIYLIGHNGDAYFTGHLLPPSYEEYDVHWGLFRKAVEADGGIVWDTNYQTNVIYDYGAILSLGRQLKNTQTNEPIGFLVIDVNEPALATMYDKARLLDGSEIILTDRAGYIISSAPFKQRVGTRLESPYLEQIVGSERGSFRAGSGPNFADAAPMPVNEQPFPRIVTYDTSEETGFKLVNVVPLEALGHDRGEIRRLVFGVVVVFVVLALLLAFFLSKRITRPIQLLRAHMHEAETGNLQNTFPVETFDEIGQLGASFNRMLGRLREVIAQVYEKQTQLREAELKAIQAQFNPHFLYNSLDSINWLARIHDVDEISDMTVALGELLRFSITNELEMIPVRDEMHLIRNYLTIQRMRNRDKVEAIIDLESELDQYYTPKLLLQPIVENAVIHGLWNKTSKGTLKVTGKKEKDRLRFIVEDDGVGFPVLETNTAHASSEDVRPSYARSHDANGTTRIGIGNIRRRLQLHFGADHAFWITSTPGKGTKVVIEIPKVTEAEATDAFNFARR